MAWVNRRNVVELSMFLSCLINLMDIKILNILAINFTIKIFSSNLNF